MPFLRAGVRTVNSDEEFVGTDSYKNSNGKSEAVAPAVNKNKRLFTNPEIPPVVQKSGDRTLSLFSLNSCYEQDNTTPATVGNPNKMKGTQYERYVGSKYEECGYHVDYNGIKKNGHDRGVDLICHSGRYTVLVQCKCYSSGSISVNTIYHFFGSSRHYAVRHPREIVSSSFWTSLKLKNDSEAFIAAEELGIRIYQGYELPK